MKGIVLSDWALSRYSKKESFTREEAIAHGDTYYFTGKPCCHGHVTFRYVNGNHCRSCIAHKSRKHTEAIFDAEGHLSWRKRTAGVQELPDIKRRKALEEQLELARIDKNIYGYNL